MTRASSGQSVGGDQGRQAGSPTQHDSVLDLSTVLRSHGVSEERIPELVLVIRAYSEAQTADAALPPAPSPPEPGSLEASRARVAEQEVIDLRAECERTRDELILVGKATRRNGQRKMFEELEVQIIPGLPRISFVGRAIHEVSIHRGKRGKAPTPQIYYKIDEKNPSLLTRALQEAVTNHQSGDADRTRLAASAFKKNLDGRLPTLKRCGFVEQTGNKVGLTNKGKRFFHEWPEWSEIRPSTPAASSPPAPAASGDAPESSTGNGE
jgi:hypothetical protein